MKSVRAARTTTSCCRSSTNSTVETATRLIIARPVVRSHPAPPPASFRLDSSSSSGSPAFRWCHPVLSQLDQIVVAKIPDAAITVAQLRAPLGVIEAIRRREPDPQEEHSGARWWTHRMEQRSIADFVVETDQRDPRNVAMDSCSRPAGWLAEAARWRMPGNRSVSWSDREPRLGAKAWAGSGPSGIPCAVPISPGRCRGIAAAFSRSA